MRSHSGLMDADQGLHRYVNKPVDLDQFLNVIRSIEDVRLTVVTLSKPC
ncbi:MAG TPA: hypothetical protein VN224_14495 [Xanthomonadales bacterium]|nr:hypothetical protein [Xanthomonadales bacterium]